MFSLVEAFVTVSAFHCDPNSPLERLPAGLPGAWRCWAEKGEVKVILWGYEKAGGTSSNLQLESGDMYASFQGPLVIVFQTASISPPSIPGVWGSAVCPVIFVQAGSAGAVDQHDTELPTCISKCTSVLRDLLSVVMYMRMQFCGS